MNLGTLFSYLVGRRDAIERIARTPGALWLGLAFVLSAGFAREYDGEYLAAEPWHLFIPLAASLGTSFVLYSFVSAAWGPRSSPVSFFSGYRRFLALYWLTAPLAWLYAIPAERFLSAADATALNLFLLFIVSAWRVALMIRVVSVRWNAPVFWSAVIVLLFADVVALVGAFSAPQPIFAVMGGVRLTESQAMISNATCAVMGWGLLALPVLLLLLVINPFINYPYRKPRPQWQPAGDAGHPERTVSRPARVLAIGSLVLGAGLLPLTQGEQQRRHGVSALFERGEVDEAVRYLSRYNREDFPPHWEPPPPLGFDPSERLIGIFESLVAEQAAPWVWEEYQAKLSQALSDRHFFIISSQDIDESRERADRWLWVFNAMPNQAAFVVENKESFGNLLSQLSSQHEHSRKAQLTAWLAKNGVVLDVDGSSG